MIQESRHQIFRYITPRAGQYMIRPPGNQIHASGKGIQRSVDREAHTGENGRAQCNPEKHRQGAAKVSAHMPQTEPDKQSKEKYQIFHG